MFKVNELVVLKNDPNQIVFVINDVQKTKVFLFGYIYRIQVIADVDKIELASEQLIEKEKRILNRTFEKTIAKKNRLTSKAIFGTVLHIDSDEKFLESCMELYKEMKVHAWGIHLKEKDIKNVIDELLNDVTPDIIVLTGHDYYNGKDKREISNYENTPKYIEAVRCIRKRFNNDSVIVIAGACCSNFEALIANGANFASSPKRIHIHTYDPAIIAIKCATTSCNQVVDFNNIIKYIENGRDAFGGIETKGKMKLLL